MKRDWLGRPAPETSAAQFDLDGDLAGVPTGYLVVSLRREPRNDRAALFVAELTRRGVDHWAIQRQGGQCSLCARRGLYVVGRTLFCRLHKTDARESAGNTYRRGVLNRKSAAIDTRLNQIDQARRKAEAHQAVLKALKNKA